MDTKVIDKKGLFFTNPHQFAFVDPDPVKERQIRYEPGTIYKVEMAEGSWLETQVNAGVLRQCDDEGNMEPVPAPKAAAPAAAPAPAPAAAPALAPAARQGQVDRR